MYPAGGAEPSGPPDEDTVTPDHHDMPPLDDLDARLDADTAWRGEYSARLPRAEHVAAAVRLVHVTRHSAWLFAHPPNAVPLGDTTVTATSPVTYCGATTHAVEDGLGFPRSAYFYAGRAEPRYGKAAFAFALGCEAGLNGAAYPWDTGCLVNHIDGPIRCALPANDLPARRDIVLRSAVALAEWRGHFAKFLAAYFSDVVDYWSGEPNRPDPDGVYSEPDQPRVAWTFEIRLEAPMPLAACEKWCADRVTMDVLRDLALSATDTTVLDGLLGGDHLLDADGADDFCERVEAWVRLQAGL